MTTNNPAKRKIKDIKHNYGTNAVAYFKKFPFCERCKENRIVLLQVHHKHGKKVELFEILCSNCHALEHNPEIAKMTYEDCVELHKKIAERKTKRDADILDLLNKKISIRKIRDIVHVDPKTVTTIALKNGFVVRPRSGYHKEIVED